MKAAMTLAVLLLGAGCRGVAPPLPEAGDPVAATPPPDCSQAVPRPPLPGSTLAFLTSAENTVRTYSIQSSGCWVRLDEDLLIDSAAAKAVHPSGRFLYASGRFTDFRPGIRVFAIDRARGALTALGDVAVGDHVPGRPGSTVALGDRLYTLSGALGTGYHNDLWELAVDADNGLLDFLGQAHQPSYDPSLLKLSAARATLFIWAEQYSPRDGPFIRALRPDGAGRLEVVAQVRAQYGVFEPDPSGHFLWHAPWDSAGRITSLEVFRIDPGGALERTVALPWDRDLPVPHPTGKVLYANGPGTVEAYRVDPATGRPTLSAGVPYAGAKARLSVDPSGDWLYAVSEDEVRAYRTDDGGALVERGRAGEGGFGPVFVRVP